MPPRNHNQWQKQPKVESISSEIYNSFNIFKQEQEDIFSKVWVPVCHMSEMPDEGNFRTMSIAGVPIVVYNFRDGEVRAYRNYDIKQVSGTFSAPVVTSEPRLHCEVKHGQMVWVSLYPNPTQSVDEGTAGAFDCFAVAI